MRTSEQFKNLLNKWETCNLSKDELLELEKVAKKLLSAVKMNLLLTDKSERGY